ncbi:MAG: hypothetical protein ACON38_14080 [Akkermansiaceae bacterium]
MTPKLLLPLSFALMAASPLFAEDTIDPKAKAILEKSVKATGERAALDKIKSRISIGKVDLPAQGMTLTVEVKQKAPSFFYSKSVIPDIMTVEQGYDGKEGWSKDSIQGARKLAGPELAQAKEGASMFMEDQLLKDLVSAKLLDDSKEGDKTYSVVEAKSKDSNAKTLFFDQSTGLLAKIVTKLAVGPGGEMTAETKLSDYKEIDGVKIPFTMNIKAGPQNMVMKFSSIEHNKEIDDSIFKMKK